MDAAAAVLAIVLLETAVGGLVLLWAAPTWGKVRHGYEVLLGSTLALLAWGAYGAFKAPFRAAVGDLADPGLVDRVNLLVLATAILAALSCIALLAKLPPLVGRLLGIASMLAGLASFVPLAQLRVDLGRGSLGFGLAELVLGAFLLGAIWDGMILGHWYLVERKLSNKYMVWMAWANVGAVVAGLAAVGLSARNPVPCVGLEGADLAVCSTGISPILAIDDMTIVIGIGVMALIALISGFNVRLANEGGRSIQASTGMFYLAVILAPAAEFAAKVRFF